MNLWHATNLLQYAIKHTPSLYYRLGSTEQTIALHKSYGPLRACLGTQEQCSEVLMHIWYYEDYMAKCTIESYFTSVIRMNIPKHDSNIHSLPPKCLNDIVERLSKNVQRKTSDQTFALQFCVIINYGPWECCWI